MEIELINQHKMLVVKITGEIDHHISNELRTQIDRTLMKSGAINVAFDFSKVTFMDSSGIGVIDILDIRLSTE